MANIAIVGGGIAGLYCAWKLIDRGHSTTLYECLDRLGGRIETQELHGFKAECGPMRFELEIEPLFDNLAKELQIEFAPFPAASSGSGEFPKYDLLPQEMSEAHKFAVEKESKRDVCCFFRKRFDAKTASSMYSHHTLALDLLKFGIYRIFHRDSDALKLSLGDVVSGDRSSRISKFAGSLTDTEYDNFRQNQDLDGVPLYTLGFWNALSRVLSSGAIAKIRETGTFYHLLPENPSASEWSIFWLRLFRPLGDLSQIEAGVGTIVARLERKIPPENIRRQTLITRIFEDRNTGKLRLTTRNGVINQEFDHAILAIPAVPLRNVSDNFPRDIRGFIDRVIPFPLVKVFVVIRNPWWEKIPSPHQGAHLVPTREVHYFPGKDGSKSLGMIMFYTDRPATAYWRPYIIDPHSSAQVGKPKALQHELVLQVAQLLPREKRDHDAHMKQVEESIINFAIRDWSEPPFGAACHAWAPGVDVPETLNQLEAFSLENSSGKKNVHVCGEAYSDYQGFIEGALRTAERVLRAI